MHADQNGSRPSEIWTPIGRGALLLTVLVNTAAASVQSTANERRVATIEPTAFSGEIDYSFDSSTNRTNARFTTSLASGNFFGRLFSQSPVHTLIAAYEFGGRTHLDSPSTVRITLISDEFRQEIAGNPFSFDHPSNMTIVVGDTVLRYPLGIAQRTEVWPMADSTPQLARNQTIIQIAGRAQVHIERTSTALIPICEFLLVVNSNDVHGTVAGLDFDFNSKVISGLRRFAAEMSLSRQC